MQNKNIHLKKVLLTYLANKKTMVNFESPEES